MRFPLFRRRAPNALAEEAQGQAEKLLVESLRMLGQVCQKLAEAVEAQRLEREGHARPGAFLRRVDPPNDSAK
jgi:hypothetical protein